MNEPIIRIENIKKVYDDRVVLEIPHLGFEKGTIYALVGPNGAGKTTLLRILNLLERPDEGKLYFDGQQIDSSSSDVLNIRRQMTLVMQNAILFRTSVYNNVAYGLKIRSYDKKIVPSAASVALSIVGLEGFEYRKAKQLSAGEAQRVAIARAIILQPRILMLDEPTANVDRRNVHVIESILRKVNADHKTTIIFTTHDLSQAHRLTDRIISLLDGKIMDGSSENMLYGSFEKDTNQQSFVYVTPSIRITVENFEPYSSVIFIDPKDIYISFEPKKSDGLNCLEGHVTSVIMVNGMIRLTISAGIELVTLVNPAIFQEMATSIFNRSVYAVFKASDVRVF